MIPLFDTNIFGDLQRGLISQSDWSRVLRRRPGHGWPLSSVTALELLAGLDAIRPEDFPSVKQRISTAFHVSGGRVLEDPRFLICKELFKIPPPPVVLPSFSATVKKYMDVVRRASSYDQLLNGVPYKRQFARLNTTSILTELMAGPKRSWAATTERLADEKYPAWRDHLLATGKRLPPEVRKELEPNSAWDSQRAVFVKALLEWLATDTKPELVAEMSERLDAVLEFTIFVVREFLLRNYSLDKHQSDVFDQFQLQYLAFDRFIIVTSDPDLSVRTRRSPQASRIMSFEKFLAAA